MSGMSFDPETFKQSIPYYLTADPAQKKLLDELAALTSGVQKGYYLSAKHDPFGVEMLQGDVWPGLKIFSFDSGDRREIKGIVLSNSCDISAENQRIIPPKITFAPIIKLSSLERRFSDSGLKPDKIAPRMQSIRSQSVSNMFFLPADGPLDDEYVALLSDIHSMPVKAHRDVGKIFTLSMAGFYLFVFKLSVHFCRLQENVDRYPRQEAC
jgi:hypothetical protein